MEALTDNLALSHATFPPELLLYIYFRLEWGSDRRVCAAEAIYYYLNLPNLVLNHICLLLSITSLWIALSDRRRATSASHQRRRPVITLHDTICCPHYERH